MVRNEVRKRESARLGHLVRLVELDLGAHQQAGDVFADRDQEPLKQQEGFLLIFVDRLLLGVAAQVDDCAQRVERRQMLLPMTVSYTHLTLPTILLLALPCLLIVLTKEWRLLSRWQKPVQYAGNLTYSSYLLHFPLQLMLAIAVAASGIIPPLTSPWFLAAYLGTTLGVAANSYRWFELPVQRWLRRRLVGTA